MKRFPAEEDEEEEGEEEEEGLTRASAELGVRGGVKGEVENEE